MQYASTPADLTFSKWNLGFTGVSKDARGKASTEFISANSANQLVIQYIPKELQIRIDEKKVFKDDFSDTIKEYKDSSIVLDSVTLTFAEILIILQTLKDLDFKDVSVIYIEPGNYKRKIKNDDILHKRDFELTQSIIGYEAIPGHALLVTRDIPQRVVFLCGFEAERIDRALEDSEILGSKCCCIFGVPAVRAGWEMDSFDNNISIIKERRITGGVSFCGATNPLSILNTLNHIYSGIEEEEQMFVVPLGSKPMSLGACLFLINKPKEKVAVLYDHPEEISDKTLEIADWHLFNINFY